MERRPRHRGDVLDNLGSLLARGQALEEGNVRAGLVRALEAGNGLVVAVGLQRVGAGNDDNVAVYLLPGTDGGPDPAEEDVLVHDLLACEVPASLGLHLVLDVQAGDSRLGVLLDRARDHDGAAVASVGISDERDGVVCVFG